MEIIIPGYMRVKFSLHIHIFFFTTQSLLHTALMQRRNNEDPFSVVPPSKRSHHPLMIFIRQQCLKISTEPGTTLCHAISVSTQCIMASSLPMRVEPEITKTREDFTEKNTNPIIFV